MDHLRAALVAAVGSAMFVLGTPGLDQFDDDLWSGGEKRAEMQDRALGPIAVLAADFNRVVRVPLVRLLQPLQRPLRIAQSWALYPRGPAKIRRFEVVVDGAVVYRSNDPERDWLGEALRYRRIRPVVGSFCYKRSRSVQGFTRWMARRATADFPAGRELELRCTVEPFPTALAPGEAAPEPAVVVSVKAPIGEGT